MGKTEQNEKFKRKEKNHETLGQQINQRIVVPLAGVLFTAMTAVFVSGILLLLQISISYLKSSTAN